jgi:TetR/AcrR family transcriptional regulator, cholesterol catabolism regulator
MTPGGSRLRRVQSSPDQARTARRGRPRAVNERSDVRAAATALFADQGYRSTGVRDIADALGIGPTSVYSHIKSKAELLNEIVIDTLDAILEVQREAITSSTDVVDRLRRAAESQVRFFVEHPNESLVAIREFRWAEGEAMTAIQARRLRYRKAFEDLLIEGDRQGRLSVENAKIAAFSIIEMAEAVPTWFRPGREMSVNQLAYLYGEYALRIAGAYNISGAVERGTP